MSYEARDKRKNDQQRRYPQWALLAVLVIGLLIGSILTTWWLTARSEPSQPVQHSDIGMNEFALTATHIVNQATAMAVATQAADSAGLGEFVVTATYIIDMATASAQATNP
jgi:hypothetical protein